MVLVNKKWDFLDPWFEALKSVLEVDDPSRIDSDARAGMGRDPVNDWRLVVAWKALAKTNVWKRNPELNKLREALLLCGALASVDNAAWVHKLQTLSGFNPAPFMDLSTTALPAHFLVEVCDGSITNWDITFQYLCSGSPGTQEFGIAITRLMAAAGRPLEWPRLCLRLLPTLNVLDGQSQDIYLLNLIDSIKHLQKIGLRQDRRVPIAFELVSLQLELRRLFESAQNVKALQELVQLGAPIDYIKLMDGSGRSDGFGTPEWREAWISFVCALCGNPLSDKPPKVSIRKLSVAASETVSSEFFYLCSALIHAQNINHFEIDGHEDGVFEPLLEDSWEMIGLALFSHESSCAVEAFSIKGMPLTEDSGNAIAESVGLAYPLDAFYSNHAPFALTRHPARTRAKPIHVHAGTEVTSYYGMDDELYTVAIPMGTIALLITEDFEKAHVFIPGRRFCMISHDALPRKRPRLAPYGRDIDDASTATSSLLKSLEFSIADPHPETLQTLTDLLEYAGGLTLTTLRLSVPNFNEELVQTVVEKCPNVEHLSLSGGSLPSLQVVEDAMTEGMPLRSLELSGMTIPHDAVNRFLSRVVCAAPTSTTTSGTPSVPLLQQLRLGSAWPGGLDDSTLNLLEAALGDGSSLEYLHFFIQQPLQSTYRRITERYHDRSFGVVREALGVSERMVFLSALRHTEAASDGGSGLELTDDLKALICMMAARPQTRIVVCGNYTTVPFS